MYYNKSTDFYLHYPLYDLLGDASSETFFNKLVDRYKHNHVGQEIEGIIAALEWATKNKNHDFKKILPGVEFTNAEILLFFEKYLSVLKHGFDKHTLVAMRVPLDNRELKILIVNNNFITGYNTGSFGGTKYKIAMASQVSDAVNINTAEKQDLLILRLDSSNEILNSLFVFTESQKSESENQIPSLVLLNSTTSIDIKKLYRFGCSQHLVLPVPKYLLLQEVYKLTT